MIYSQPRHPIGFPEFDPRQALTTNRKHNRLTSTVDAATTSYTTNPLNQYSQISPPSPSSPVVLLHDDDGNQIDAMIHPEGAAPKAAVFVWDAENRLIAVKDKATNAVIVTYTYDADSRRVARTEGSNTSVYLYDAWNVSIRPANLGSGFRAGGGSPS